MRSSRVVQVAWCIILLLRWAGYAYAEEPPNLALSMTFLKASGLKAQIKQIPKALLVSLPADAFVDAKTKNRVERLFYGKADADEWTTFVAGELAKEVDAAVLDELIRFYSSRVGRKLGAVNEGALNPWNIQRVREGYTRVPALSDTRLVLLKELVETSGLERFNADAVDAVVRGLLEGYAGQSSKLELTKEDTEATFQHSRKIARGRTGELCLVSLANSLSPLSDQDLAAIRSFFQSHACREVQRAYQNALQSILRDAAYTLGESLRETGHAARDGGASSQ
ncbi:MAG: hypothetical protein ACP5M0_06235 [Desulfomonilaceae bacterium]